jgi:hypothetical protein
MRRIENGDAAFLYNRQARASSEGKSLQSATKIWWKSETPPSTMIKKETVRVFVRLDHVASFIVNADHGVM